MANQPDQAIRLPRILVNQLLHHAQQADDKEVCGFISSRSGVPLSAYPVTNIAATPEHRFAMDPPGQIHALRQMRERHEELFAIYHSHPSSPAIPSAIDMEEAGYPETLYLIISLSIKGVLEVRGFRLDTQRAEEVALELE